MSGAGQPSWLARFAGVEYDDWPPWAKAKLRLCRVAVHGAAATSVRAAARGVSVPRGGATRERAEQLGASGSTWSLTPTARRRIRRAALALLPAPDGEALPDPADGEDFAIVADSTSEPLGAEELEELCESACQAGDGLAVGLAPPRPAVGAIDFALENPVNALWLILLTAHPFLERWGVTTTSYCMRREWDMVRTRAPPGSGLRTAHASAACATSRRGASGGQGGTPQRAALLRRGTASALVSCTRCLLFALSPLRAPP